MSRFGKIQKTKLETKVVEKTVYVKSWRAKLAERLLGKDLEELESHIRAEFEDKHYSDVKEEAENMVDKWWRNYKYELDDEILSIFPDYEPFLNFQPYNGKDNAPEVVEPSYKKVRINGQFVAFMPRFKKKATDPAGEHNASQQASTEN